MLIFFFCTLDKVYDSLSYSRVVHTQAQQTLDFVRILNFSLSLTLTVSRAEVPEALPMQQLISVSNYAFHAILGPWYTTLFYIFDILDIDIVS